MKTNVTYSLLVCTMLLFTGLSVSGQPLPNNRPGFESNRPGNDRQRRLQLLTDYLRYHKDITVKEYSNLIRVSTNEGLRDLMQFVSDRTSGIVQSRNGRSYTLVSIGDRQPGFGQGDRRPNDRPTGGMNKPDSCPNGNSSINPNGNSSNRPGNNHR